MAIAYQTISALQTVTGTAGTPVSMTIAEPAGATTNDLLVACISFRGATTPSIPSPWNIVNRTVTTGNTDGGGGNQPTAIASGLMAWTKRGSVALTAAERTFGGVTGQQFPDLAFGYILRLNGQDLIDPIAGTSVNTLVTGVSGVITTGSYSRSFSTAATDDFIEIMLCMGGQEVTWGTQQYITGPVNFTELVDQASTSGADGSISIARSTTVGNTTGGFRATSTGSNARHALMVASFGGPRPAATARSFSVFV